jgi:DNA-binding transcriptional LysR family regulator
MSEIQLHKMDLNLLATFEALIEEGSVAAAADRLALTPSAVSHALGRLRTQFGDPLFVRVGGKMQPTPQALLLAGELGPVLRGLRRALKPTEPFDPATSDRVFRIALHSSPAFMARTTAVIGAAAPNTMLEWVRIRPDNLRDLADGLIDLLHVGGPPHLMDGINSVELEPVTFFTFARRGHPAAENWSAETASLYRYLQVAIEDKETGGSPIEREHRLHNRPRTLGGKVHDFPLVGPLLASSDFIATMPSFAMEEMWKLYDLQVLEPVAAPKDFRMRFAWSARNASDPGNTWLRDTVVTAYAAHQADINRQLDDVAIPLGGPP